MKRRHDSALWLYQQLRDHRVRLAAVDRLAAWAGARPGAAYGEIVRAACQR